MRVLKTSLFVLASSLALTGCLGTNTPASPGAAINLSESGSSYVATRGAGFDAMTTHITSSAIDGGTIDTDSTNAGLTAYTNSSSGANGFILNLPGDASTKGADQAVLDVNAFTDSAQLEFPSGTKEAAFATYDTGTIGSDGSAGTVDNGNILVDKFGASQGLQDSEYGMWAETAASTAGISATTATTAGVFAIGIPTTIMPASGGATYTGGAAGIATSPTGGGEFAGTANLTATFTAGGGSISGTITDIKFLPAGDANLTANVGTMNNIILSGTNNIAGNTFSGGATVGSAGTSGNGTNFDISGASSGSFGGQFNGLSAAEVAGTFKLSSGSGAATTNVIGAFGARQ